ncbi:MAG: radical SAM family heme chaperone HemW [Ginsengibacter sp.]
MIAALKEEISLLTTEQTEKEIVKTIYFGGGTPSLLDPTEIDGLIKTVRDKFLVSNDAEITLEANPDDITAFNLDAWKSAGINRFSLGIQSLNDANLKWMNRIHNSSQVFSSVEMIRKQGFNNFSVDLIYGTPGNYDWQKDIDSIVSLNAPHMACYALTVEPGTALNKMIAANKKAPVSSELQAEQFEYIMQVMKEKEYEHYEISNFAKPGFRSRHNSSYWKGEKYWGIGPSAHSYDREKRRWNISNNALYIKSIQGGLIPFEEELLSPKDKYNEFIMIRLRMAQGINLTEMSSLFGDVKVLAFVAKTTVFQERGKVIKDNNRIYLTNEGKLLADGIASSLFI